MMLLALQRAPLTRYIGVLCLTGMLLVGFAEQKPKEQVGVYSQVQLVDNIEDAKSELQRLVNLLKDRRITEFQERLLALPQDFLVRTGEDGLLLFKSALRADSKAGFYILLEREALMYLSDQVRRSQVFLMTFDYHRLWATEMMLEIGIDFDTSVSGFRNYQGEVTVRRILTSLAQGEELDLLFQFGFVPLSSYQNNLGEHVCLLLEGVASDDSRLLNHALFDLGWCGNYDRYADRAEVSRRAIFATVTALIVNEKHSISRKLMVLKYNKLVACGVLGIDSSNTLYIGGTPLQEIHVDDAMIQIQERGFD